MLKSKKNIFFVITLAILSLSIFISNAVNFDIVFADNLIDIDAKAYYVFEGNSMTTLAEKDSTVHYEVASMVKLMTSLLTIEKIEIGDWNLEDKLCVSEYAASMEGSQAFLDAGKSYKIDDLLKSVIVASANDSSVVLAENYAGTENNFVDYMNSKAKELGMTETLYSNSTGLPSATNQYSTAKDIAIILNEVSKHELYKKYSNIWMDKIVHFDGRETELVNTNRLVKYYPGCICGKTGFTDEAGYCLSVVAEKNDMNIISVVMGAKSSSDRFNYSANLLNFGFSNYRNNKVVDCNEDIATEIKLKGSKEEILCRPREDLYLLEKQGTTENYVIEKIYENLKGNIAKGDVVGKIVIIKDGNVVKETQLISVDNYHSATFIDSIKNIFKNWEL